MLSAAEAPGPEGLVDMHARRFGVALALGPELKPADLMQIGRRHVRSMCQNQSLSDADERRQLHRLLLRRGLYRMALIGPSCSNGVVRRHVVEMLRKTIEALAVFDR